MANLESLLWPALLITHRNEVKVQNIAYSKPAKKLSLGKEIVIAQKLREKQRTFPRKIQFTKCMFDLCGTIIFVSFGGGNGWSFFKAFSFFPYCICNSNSQARNSSYNVILFLSGRPQYLLKGEECYRNDSYHVQRHVQSCLIGLKETSSICHGYSSALPTLFFKLLYNSLFSKSIFLITQMHAAVEVCDRLWEIQRRI